jgi:hypothetical protein
MKHSGHITLLAALAISAVGRADDLVTNATPQLWNWNVQNTFIVQYHPGFPSAYRGPNSLSSANEVKETLSLDLLAGARLWR